MDSFMSKSKDNDYMMKKNTLPIGDKKYSKESSMQSAVRGWKNSVDHLNDSELLRKFNDNIPEMYSSQKSLDTSALAEHLKRKKESMN